MFICNMGRARALGTYGRAWEQMGTSCVEVGSSSMQNWGTGQQDDMTSALVAPGTSMSGSQLAGTFRAVQCLCRASLILCTEEGVVTNP